MKNVLKLVLLFSIIISCIQESVIAQETVVNNSITYKEKLYNYLSKLEKSGFSGTVLVTKNDKVLLEKGYGYADRENKILCTPETTFDIGSITKQFTAAAILKLEMQGKLSIGDKLSKYFPNIPTDKNDITIHHLLTHSSGFQPAIGGDYEKISPKKFIKKAFKSNLLFKPGTKFVYSNLGYSFLGIVIEKVSGMSYEEYLMTYLWKPVKMFQTGYQKPLFKDIASGYHNNDHWGKPTDKKWDIDGPYWHLKANGGVLSTIQDMHKWHQALLDDEILDPNAKSKLYSKHIEEKAGSYYGYGWFISNTIYNKELISHSGYNGVFFADIWRYIKEDITIIIMTNAVQEKFENIASQIAGILLQPGFEPIMGKQSAEIITVKMIDQVVEEFIDIMNQNNQKTWRSFIENRMTATYKNSISMEEHLELFKELHQNFTKGKVIEVMISGHLVGIGIKTKKHTEYILFDITTDSKKEVLIKGIR